MRTTGLVVVVVMVVGGLGCFSTARYDDAHLQRVASINARYEAETAQAQRRERELASLLEADRALLISIKPGSRSAPVSRVDEREAMVECRKQCDRRGMDDSLDEWRPNDQVKAQCLHEICEPAYVDALTRTYFDADVRWVTNELAASEGTDFESLLAFSHNQALAQHIEEEAHDLAKLQAQTPQRFERDRQAEIAASAQRRDSEIASGRAAHRARIQAASLAARDPGPVAARPSSLCAADAVDDERSSRVAVCGSEPALPDSASSARSAQLPTGER